jgi:hypothetical protein
MMLGWLIGMNANGKTLLDDAHRHMVDKHMSAQIKVQPLQAG